MKINFTKCFSSKYRNKIEQFDGNFVSKSLRIYANDLISLISRNFFNVRPSLNEYGSFTNFSLCGQMKMNAEES